jgi:AraC-like DNA-binding protein
MQHIHIPQAVKKHLHSSCGDITFMLYKEHSKFEKNRVIFNVNVISFVVNGVKDIYKATQHHVINTGEAVLITEGNSILAEHSLNTSEYSSILIFFPTKYAVNFLDKIDVRLQTPVITDSDDKLLKFRQTAYQAGYLQSLLHIIEHQSEIPPALAIHKLEELFLSLPDKQLQKFAAIFQPEVKAELSLKKLVEKNLLSNLTLDEIAFLANKSLSTFKRDFEKAYNISPGKYIRERKLEIASAELLQGKRAADLYLDLGYESVSNFTSAFKKHYGITPKQYQLQQKSA